MSQPPEWTPPPSRRGADPRPPYEQHEPYAQPPPEASGVPLTRSTKPGVRFSAKQIVAAVLAVLALVFILENTRDTRIRLIFPVVTMPLWVALIATAALGAAVTFLLMWRRQRSAEQARARRS